MLIPIGHDKRVGMPYVTIAIIAACTLMQLYSSLAAPDIDDIFRNPDLLDKHPIIRFGYVTDSGFGYRLVTSAFVHDGWFHLIGNMLFLWLAGSAVEDRWGHILYGVFYIAGAAASVFVFEGFYNGPETILVGASGAISATMGAFLVHYAKTTIMFWYWIGRSSGTFDWPAWVALPLWLLDQFLWTYLYGASGGISGVAYSAHIGGFLFGFAAGFAANAFLPKRDDDDGEPVVLAPPPQPSPNDRVQQLATAIENRDIATTRTLASRVFLDLARAGDDAKLVELYNAMSAQLTKPPLTDGAFVAAANAADKLGHKTTFVAIAEAVIAEHPGSNQIPKTMWRLAELRRDAGALDAAIELLRLLATRFPRDAYGQQARQALDSRGIE